MDKWLANHRCARCISTCITILYEASENARNAQRGEILTELENLAEDLIKLHRDVLELPPQSSTALADVDEAPF